MQAFLWFDEATSARLAKNKPATFSATFSATQPLFQPPFQPPTFSATFQYARPSPLWVSAFGGGICCISLHCSPVAVLALHWGHTMYILYTKVFLLYARIKNGHLLVDYPCHRSPSAHSSARARFRLNWYKTPLQKPKIPASQIPLQNSKPKS